MASSSMNISPFDTVLIKWWTKENNLIYILSRKLEAMNKKRDILLIRVSISLIGQI